MRRQKQQLQATEKEMEEHISAYQAIWKKADDEDRDTTPEEREEVEQHLKALEVLKQKKSDVEDEIKVLDDVNETAKGLGIRHSGIDVEEVSNNGPVVEQYHKSWGEQFVDSAEYKSLINKMQTGNLGSDWKSGGIELKGTFGVTTTGPGTAFYQPEMQPGVVQNLYQPPTVADLMAQGQTNSPIVRYITESTTVVNAAAGVAAGGAKPESTIDFVQVDEPVKKIATLLPVQDEMLEDAAQIQSYINNRLSLFIKLTEDTDLLRGAGGNSLQGIIGRTGVNTLGTAAAGTIPIEHVFKAANGVRGSSFLNPDSIVINPTSWQNIRLAKDTAGQYFGGGPFYGAYGQPSTNASANRFQTGENIWGLNVVVTSALGAGTAVVGAFREGAQVFRRSGITVEATNSHSTYFANNLTAIRAEERLALAVYRPAAFCVLTF